MPIGYNANQLNNFNTQNVQPLFPQPTGNVYNINSTLEVANVPVGAGISVALCMPESVMYIKTMQNGNPLFYPYKISPLTNEDQITNHTNAAAPQESDLKEEIEKCKERIEDLQKQLKKLSPKGGFDI